MSHPLEIPGATRKCRRPLGLLTVVAYAGAHREQQLARSPGLIPHAAGSPGVQLKRVELTGRPRAHAQLHSSRACEVCGCTCACAWLRACLNKPCGKSSNWPWRSNTMSSPLILCCAPEALSWRMQNHLSQFSQHNSCHINKCGVTQLSWSYVGP